MYTIIIVSDNAKKFINYDAEGDFGNAKRAVKELAYLNPNTVVKLTRDNRLYGIAQTFTADITPRYWVFDGVAL